MEKGSDDDNDDDVVVVVVTDYTLKMIVRLLKKVMRILVVEFVVF